MRAISAVPALRNLLTKLPDRTRVIGPDRGKVIHTDPLVIEGRAETMDLPTMMGNLDKMVTTDPGKTVTEATDTMMIETAVHRATTEKL